MTRARTKSPSTQLLALSDHGCPATPRATAKGELYMMRRYAMTLVHSMAVGTAVACLAVAALISDSTQQDRSGYIVASS